MIFSRRGVESEPGDPAPPAPEDVLEPLARRVERLGDLGHEVEVREGGEGVRQVAVDAQLAGHAEAADARVEVDRVVEERIEAADLDVRVRQPVGRSARRGAKQFSKRNACVLGSPR